MIAAELFVDLLGAYALIGMLFAIVFVTVGIGYVDPIARGSTLGFRAIVFPGVVLLWPFLFSRWLTNRRQS